MFLTSSRQLLVYFKNNIQNSFIHNQQYSSLNNVSTNIIKKDIFYPTTFQKSRSFTSFIPYDESDEVDHFQTTFDYDIEIPSNSTKSSSYNSFSTPILSSSSSSSLSPDKSSKKIRITTKKSTLNNNNNNNLNNYFNNYTNNIEFVNNNNNVNTKIKVRGKKIKTESTTTTTIDNNNLNVSQTLPVPTTVIEEERVLIKEEDIDKVKEKSKSKTKDIDSDIEFEHPLTMEQEKIVNLIVEKGKNVFFTGSAGTGKSFVLKYLVARLREKYPKSVFVTAATGIAAVNIGGTTLHSFAGIHLGTASAEKLAAGVIKSKKYLQKWREAKVLIIDEISMIDSELFEKLNTIGKIIRGNSLPFGGIQLVLVGDFFQLPPVYGTYTFESKFWEECVDMCLELTTVMRQKEIEFINVLNSIRVGKVHDGIIKSLEQCARPLDVSNGVLPTKLYATNQHVDDENKVALEALPSDPMIFTSHDSGHKDMLENLDRDCPATQSLTLKIGAQVVLLRKLEKNDSLVNGSRGVVVDFVKTRAKKRFAKFYQENPLAPVVLFNDGQKVTIPPMEWGIWSENKASRVQLPLKLAWALTIHRAQGMTLDKVECQLSQTFAYGQGYVALSRVRSLSGLYLKEFQRSAIKTSSKVIQFNRKINKLGY